MSNLCSHVPLLYSTRGDVLDCIYYGSFYYFKDGKISSYLGESPNKLVYMRSLAKPLQASIMCDTNVISDFNLKEEEIAMFCGSHAGSSAHIKVLEKLLKKFNLSQNDLVLAPQRPLDDREFDGKKSKLQNNCSAKHIMMLIMCQYFNFDIKNYNSLNHPLQKIILKKQQELSEEKCEFLSYDGCSTPLWAISYEGILRSYFKLLNDKKYEILFNSILKYPYLFGGFSRFDSEIIELSSGKLFSKVGAGGFVIVYNFEKNEFLLVKMAQNNNEIRRLVTLELLNKLGWLEYKKEEYEINQIGQKVTKYHYEINF